MNATSPRLPLLVRHPWVLVVFAFLVLLGFWTALIVIAVKSSPESIEWRTPAK